MPKVVVVTRTKERPLFLKRALKSVADQTYVDYVHVIVNDGGDPSAVDEIVDGLEAGQKARTEVFHRSVSSGAPDTIFNESIDRIDSKYFAVHDDDDTWHPDFLNKTVKHLEFNDTLAAAVVLTDRVIESVENEKILQKKVSRWMPDLKVISLYRQCIDNQFTPISTLFRRSSYEAVGKFDETLPVVGDWEFGVRLLQKYDAEVIESPHALAYYHHRVVSDNSFVEHNHRYYTNKVMNRYLRNDLNAGNLGIGYIMSQLKYDQSSMFSQIKSLLPGFIVRKIQRKRLHQ